MVYSETGYGPIPNVNTGGHQWHAESHKAQFLHYSCSAVPLTQTIRKNQIAYHSYKAYLAQSPND